MSVTFDTLITQTEKHLLGGDRDALNQLLADTPANAIDIHGRTILFFTEDLFGIQAGAYVAVDLEIFYVWEVDNANKTATVQRGMLGSEIADHVAGDLVYVNPKFSKWDIANAINMEIRDLSAPPKGLWAVKEFTVITQPVQKTYEIPVGNTDLLAILEIRYQPPGPELRWERIWQRDWQILRNMPQSGQGVTFPNTGMGIRVDPPLYPGRTMSVRYAAPFSELVNLTDDAVAVSGIPSTAIDIPPLGAAARLMGVREAKRAFTESEVDTRRAQEVPPGSAGNAARTIMALLDERIKTEYMRLVEQWPSMR